MVLLLKDLSLDRLLLHNLGMEFLLLDKKAVTVKAYELLSNGFGVA